MNNEISAGIFALMLTGFDMLDRPKPPRFWARLTGYFFGILILIDITESVTLAIVAGAALIAFAIWKK